MKIANLIIGVLFVMFAVVQLNDPDPIVWTSIYGGMAIISFFAAFGKYNLWILAIALGVILFELTTLYPELSGWIDEGMPSITGTMKAESPHIEFMREFLGILICFTVLVFHYYGFRRARTGTLA